MPVLDEVTCGRRRSSCAKTKAEGKERKTNRLNVRNGGQRVRSLDLGRLDLIWSDQSREGRRAGGATR